ncbi:MAG: hypothetical protein IKD77_05820 [Bacilli bacterium]|nr:hypothetical protein [Bacilli bacterium]
MSKYITEYSKDSRQDLIGIKRYIKYTLQEPNIADKMISKIKMEIDKLVDNPEIYAIIDDCYISVSNIAKILNVILGKEIITSQIVNNIFKDEGAIHKLDNKTYIEEQRKGLKPSRFYPDERTKKYYQKIIGKIIVFILGI